MKYDASYVLNKLEPTANFTAIGTEYSDVTWFSEDIIMPTENVVSSSIAELDREEPMRLLRLERDKRLQDVDWEVIKSLSLGTSIPSELSNYMQALRDLPSTSSPSLDSSYDLDLNSVTWPTRSI